MNQMNASNNFLYIQKKYKTFEEINFNNMINILSLINLGTVELYHYQHPLITCKNS